MANRERGEVGITIGDRAYTLRPTFNSVCELEGLISKSFDVVMQEINEGRLSGLRATVWCLLQEHHSEEIKTLKDAGKWVEDAGGVEKIRDLLYQSFEANTEPTTEGQKANPPKAQAGTGARSSSRRTKSA
jgi:hypothetical protein